MKQTIFYSWQSDIEFNKKFIGGCIRKAIKELKGESDFYYLTADESTRGESGAINISKILFEKIANCDIFIAETSIVNFCDDKALRFTPNPNVLIELGYASSEIGWERIITITDVSNDSLIHLPFDIEHHRTIKFDFKNGKEEDLIGKLKSAINLINKKKSINTDIKEYVNSKVEYIFTYSFHYIQSLTSVGELEPTKVFRDLIIKKRKTSIEKMLSKIEIRGFYAYRSFQLIIDEIESVLGNPLVTKYLSKKTTSILIRLMLEMGKFGMSPSSSFSKRSRNKMNFDELDLKVIDSNLKGVKELRRIYGKGFSVEGKGHFKYYFDERDLRISIPYTKTGISKTSNFIHTINELYKQWINDIGRKK